MKAVIIEIDNIIGTTVSRWRRIVLICILFTSYCDATAQTEKPARLSEKEKEQGWKFLFDGTSAREWTGIKGTGFPEKGWTVKNGILTVLGGPGIDHTTGGDIITKEQYSNFELSLEFIIPEGANSGIKYFVSNQFPGQEGNYLGLEFQLVDNQHHPDAQRGLNGNRTLASLYDLIPAKNAQASQTGTWNTAKIIVDGDHVEHWLNGRKVVAFERHSEAFRRLVAASKYKSLKDFGELSRGHILLQAHGDTVHFRNIRIRVLPR